MRAIVFVVVFCLVGVIALGFFRGWFWLSTNSTDYRPSATITVDKDKIHADEKLAKEKMQGFGHEAKQDLGDRAGKAAEPEHQP